MVVTVKAIYQDGVFKPLEAPNVPDNQEVELEIKWLAPPAAVEGPKSFASLRGVWSHLPMPDEDEVNRILGENRAESNRKLERIARELNEELGSEPPDTTDRPS